jgi:CelD/BcsL family acetyltransferase involved in cellulose biosynthesis
MDQDVLMYLLGAAFVAIFLVALPALLIALSRHDFRAEDSEHLGPTDFTESDFDDMSAAVQSALVDFSVKRITQSELNDVLEKSRTT